MSHRDGPTVTKAAMIQLLGHTGVTTAALQHQHCHLCPAGLLQLSSLKDSLFQYCFSPLESLSLLPLLPVHITPIFLNPFSLSPRKCYLFSLISSENLQQQKTPNQSISLPVRTQNHPAKPPLLILHFSPSLPFSAPNLCAHPLADSAEVLLSLRTSA